MFRKLVNFLIFSIILVKEVINLSVVEKGLLTLEKNSVAIQFYIDIENEAKNSMCKVYSYPKKCCLYADKQICVLDTFGGGHDIVKPRDRRTLLFTTPLLHQHNQIGHCDFIIQHRCSGKKETIEVTIPFDTRIKRKISRLITNYIGEDEIMNCDTDDQDSFNDCAPVDCDIKYLGQRIFYDNNTKHCLELPICLGDVNREFPDIIYVPNGNICRDLDRPLTMQDIYAISSGLGTITIGPGTEDSVKLELKSNCSTISQNLSLLRDIMFGKLCPVGKGEVVDYSSCFNAALLSIVICIISACVFIFLFAFCIVSSVWLMDKWRDGTLENWCRKFRGRNVRGRKIVNNEIRNTLLRDIIVRDIPLELRDSVVDICDRVGREVRKKRRYRMREVGSQISLVKEKETSSSVDE